MRAFVWKCEDLTGGCEDAAAAPSRLPSVLRGPRVAALAALALLAWVGTGECGRATELADGAVASNVSDTTIAGATGCTMSRPIDQVWLVSTRNLSCADAQREAATPQIWQLDAQGKWQASTRDAFIAAENPRTPTAIWVHGNRVDYSQAAQIGLAVYHQTVHGAPADQPLRFVIWSWPSDPLRGPVDDARVKAQRANLEGFYLGDFVARTKPHGSVTLIGYSFGARVAAGATQIVAGGELFGHQLPPAVKGSRPLLNVVLLAAALDNDWFAPGHRMGQALTQVRRLLTVDDCSDRVLEHYYLLDTCKDIAALGYTGAVGLPAEYREKVTQMNVSYRQHDWENYIFNASVIACVRTYVFGAAPAAPASPKAPARSATVGAASAS